MSHIQGRRDSDLHLDNWEHRSTSVATSGRALELFEKRIQEHLAEHREIEARKVDAQ